MDHILITAAEQEELICAQQAFKAYEAKLGARNISVDFMLTGIGTTSTCYRLTKKIMEAANAKKPYSLVINIGIAGSYAFRDSDNSPAPFPMGSVAIIEKEYFGDLGFETIFGFQTLFQYDILDADVFPFKGGALHRKPLNSQMEEFLGQYNKAIGVTVQTVTGNPERTVELRKQFSPHIESMEGAAVYYVCLLEDIPCFELRTVSNEVGERDRNKWNTPLALESLKSAMTGFFGSICNDAAE